MLVKITEIKRETPKAWLVNAETTSGFADVWIPKSQASIDGKMADLPKWLANKKDLLEYGTSKTVLDLRAEFEDGNEAEAELAREEVLCGELESVRKAIKRASELTGMTIEEIKRAA